MYYRKKLRRRSTIENIGNKHEVRTDCGEGNDMEEDFFLITLIILHKKDHTKTGMNL